MYQQMTCMMVDKFVLSWTHYCNEMVVLLFSYKHSLTQLQDNADLIFQPIVNLCNDANLKLPKITAYMLTQAVYTQTTLQLEFQITHTLCIPCAH